MEKTANREFETNELVRSNATPGFFDRLLKKIFIQALSKMNKGMLRILDSDGTEYVLGDKNHRPFSAMMMIHKNSFYKKAVKYGDIGFAESYLDGDWDTDNISAVISWFLLNVEESPSFSGSGNKPLHLFLFNAMNRLYHRLRTNSIRGSRKNISAHYDIGNNFYKLFLDKTMTYSSAYFYKDDISLEEAQTAKYDSICQLLRLNSNHHLLEIGSGWGGFAIHAAKKYNCRITTITISHEQFSYAKKRIEEEGLSHLIDIQIKDYRHITGKYDRIVSIEMLEAVGHEFYETYFGKCAEVLKPDGLLGVQVITSPDSRYEEFRNGIDFIQKHIFPGSLLPSIARMNEAINNTSTMNLFELKDLGLSYAKTLALWLKTFDTNLAQIRSIGYDETFVRMWRYYLSYCEAAFKMRNITVVQAVYTRPNNLSI